MPAISIVVPCYNGGAFIEGLLESLRLQTFRDYEVVIVDDGSSDPATIETLKSVEKLARVVRQSNRGLPSARNTGFREAIGDLVLPLDCDDRLAPSFLAATYRAMQEAPAAVGFVFTHMRVSGGLEGHFETHCNRFDQLFLNHLPYAMLIRKSAWQKVGGYDETMRDGLEDWEFNLRLLSAGYGWIEIPEPLFGYTVRADGMLLSHSARMQATTWARIRRKFPELYRLPAMISIWRASRPGMRSTLRATMLWSMAAILPENLCNRLFFQMNIAKRKWRSLRGGARPVRVVDP